MKNLKKYNVAVTEIFRKTVSVLAFNERDARRRANDGWLNCEIILDENDFLGAEFCIVSGGQETDKQAGQLIIQGYGDAEDVK